MQKRNFTVLSVFVLTLIILIPTQLSFVSSTAGNIKINTKSASTPGQQVQVGGNVSLYFGDINLPSGNLYLVLSQKWLTTVFLRRL
jgi:hypothetical protein